MPLDDANDFLIAGPALLRRVYGARAPSKGELNANALQVLVAFADDPGQSDAQLAGRLALDESTIRHGFRLLGKHELVDNKPDPADERHVTRTITAAGRRRSRALVAEAQRLLDEHAKPQG